MMEDFKDEAAGVSNGASKQNTVGATIMKYIKPVNGL